MIWFVCFVLLFVLIVFCLEIVIDIYQDKDEVTHIILYYTVGKKRKSFIIK